MNPNRSERKFHVKLILITALVTLIISFGAAYLFGYIGPRQAPPSAEGPEVLVEGRLLGETDEARIYTCSMHPQIRQPEPGDCPICGMDLIPLETDAGSDEGPRTMRMSESARALAEIQTVQVRREFPEARVGLVGKLEYDETREKSLTARFPARIDTLFVNFTGIQVKQGEHLAKVYSPELLSAQRELLAAHRSDPDSFMARAAREKLLLWDLLPDQDDRNHHLLQVRVHH